jgi:hypothetical protein
MRWYNHVFTRKTLLFLLILSPLIIFSFGIVHSDPPPNYYTVTEVNYSKTWISTELEKDPYLGLEITPIDEDTISTYIYEKQPMPPGEKWQYAVCIPSNATINVSGQEFSPSLLEGDWCNQTGNYGFLIKRRNNNWNLPIEVNVTIPDYLEGLYFMGGNGTFVNMVNSTDEGLGGSEESWNHKVFFDPINDRWHIVYIDSNADISTYSSSDGTTWDAGVVIDADTYDYDDFDCALQLNSSNTYMYCAYSSATINAYFIRCELNSSAPYVNCDAEEVPYQTSSFGGTINDDVYYPRITFNADGCGIMVFDFYNDSAGASDDQVVTMIKEASPCGDGDWDTDDMESGYPIYNIQTDDVGYTNPFGIGITSYGDNDSFVTWIDGTSNGNYDLEGRFYNGTSNSFGTQVTMDADVEGGGGYTSEWTVIVGNASITFGMDDGTQDLDAYILDTKSDTTTTQIDTLINMYDANNVPALVTATVDTVATLDTIWVFAVDSTDPQDIYYSKSNDSGATWYDQTLWVDEGDADEIKFVSAYFNNETCDIMVNWLGGATSPFKINTNIISTGSCTPDVALWLPENDSTESSSTVNFLANVTHSSTTISLTNFSLYTNTTGSWVLNQTKHPEFPTNQTYDSLNDLNSSGSVLYFKMSEDPVNDYSGNGNNGTTVNQATIQAGFFGDGVELDGVNDEINVPYDQSLNETVTGKLTLSAWVNTDSIGINHQAIINKHDTSVTGYVLEILYTNIKFSFDDTTTNFVQTTNNPIQANQWYHVGATWNGSNISIYVDGKKVGTATDYGGLTEYTGDIDIGTLAGAWDFDGTIDEVRIYNRSLSDAEMERLYNVTKDYKVNFTVDDITDGTYGWNVLAVDEAGTSNFANDNFTVTVDTTADTSPVVNLINPANATSSSNTSYNFTCEVDDDNKVVNSTLYVWYDNNTLFNTSVNDTNFTTITNVTFNVTSFVVDTYYWNCLVYDNATTPQSSWATNNYTLTVTAADTCTPPSVDNNWSVDCTDNCLKDAESIDLGNGNLSLDGSGTFTINNTNLTYNNLAISNGCTYRVQNNSIG